MIVVQKKKSAAGSFGEWGWRELTGVPLAWFDCLAVILSRIELDGTWPEGRLNACIAVIPKVDGDSTPPGERPLCVLSVVGSGHRCGWGSLLVGFNLGCLIRFSALEVVEALLRLGIPLLWKLRLWLGVVTPMYMFLLRMLSSLYRAILDFVLGRLGLPGWFRRCFFLTSPVSV